MRSGRGTAAHRRVQPHLPADDPTAPGCCTCGLPVAARNQLHLTELPPVDPAVTEAEHRKLGEHD